MDEASSPNGRSPWGRTQAGQLRADLEDRRSDEAIVHTVDALHPEADRKQVVVHLTNPLPKNKVDYVIIESALCNVVSNAIKFSHTSRTVTVNVTRVGGEMLPKMIDANVGMEPGKLARLRAGHLVESTEGTEHEAGSRLGLAICRDIVETDGTRLRAQRREARKSAEKQTFPDSPFVGFLKCYARLNHHIDA